jgi:hypothetical protein
MLACKTARKHIIHKQCDSKHQLRWQWLIMADRSEQLAINHTATQFVAKNYAAR